MEAGRVDSSSCDRNGGGGKGGGSPICFAKEQCADSPFSPNPKAMDLPRNQDTPIPENTETASCSVPESAQMKAKNCAFFQIGQKKAGFKPKNIEFNVTPKQSIRISSPSLKQNPKKTESTQEKVLLLQKAKLAQQTSIQQIPQEAQTSDIIHVHQIPRPSAINMLCPINNDGFLAVHQGMKLFHMRNMFCIDSFIEKGSTCCVFRAHGQIFWNGKVTEDSFAIKIFKKFSSAQEMCDQEYELLSKIYIDKKKGSEYLPRVFDKFMHEEHYVEIMELLGQNVYSDIKQRFHNDITVIHGYDVVTVGVYSNHIAFALALIHSNGFLHGDLKPENVVKSFLQKDGKLPKIVKLIDFSSILPIERAGTIFPLTTPYYRAPEICLHLYYTEQVDVWSFGCLIFELFTGHPLFLAEDDKILLLLMEHFIGPLPKEMLENSKIKEDYAKEKSKTTDDIIKTQFVQGTLEKYVKEFYWIQAKTIEEKAYDTVMRQRLWDLLSKCLVFDPKKRITIDQIIEHPFITFENLKEEAKKIV